MRRHHAEKVAGAEAAFFYPIGAIHEVAALDKDRKPLRIAQALENGDVSIDVLEEVLNIGLRHASATMSGAFIIEQVGFVGAVKIAYRAFLPAMIPQEPTPGKGAAAGMSNPETTAAS
jgi:hypothetical protein